MKFSKLLLVAFLGATVFVSCSDDDDKAVDIPLGAYDNGILVLNEGNGTAGSVTFIGNDMTTIQQNVYGAENEGDGIGGYVQSIFFDGDKAFIISNASNKITVVNRYTFKLIAKIETGFNVPRYGVVENGKAYVTNMGSFTDLTDDYVAVINLSDYSLEAPIALNAIGERILEENGNLYITNGSYGEGNTVTVINASTKAIIKTIPTVVSPTSFDEENGVLYILCGNYSDASKLVRVQLSNNEIIDEVTFPEALGNAQNLTIEDGKLYFTVNSDVFATTLNTATVSATPLFTSQATTLYGFAVEDNKIYVSDAKDYASDGEVFIYSTTGALQKQFPVGLIPNGFYFND
ncbi:MAG: hypothetical protein EOO46_03715 [Flavobacterium sp.]|nr:MAG: hypothetical protein EOO46_03715 [Flavobacterium sp.]